MNDEKIADRGTPGDMTGADRTRPSAPSSGVAIPAAETIARPGAEWTNEQLAQQYRAEIRQRFEAENSAHRSEEIADSELARREHPKAWADLVAREPSFARPGDSQAWNIYVASEIQIERNCVRIVLPPECSVDPDLIRMFDDTSVAWTRPTIMAKIVDGRARVVVDLILVDYWDDDRARAWSARASASEKI